MFRKSKVHKFFSKKFSIPCDPHFFIIKYLSKHVAIKLHISIIHCSTLYLQLFISFSFFFVRFSFSFIYFVLSFLFYFTYTFSFSISSHHPWQTFFLFVHFQSVISLYLLLLLKKIYCKILLYVNRNGEKKIEIDIILICILNLQNIIYSMRITVSNIVFSRSSCRQKKFQLKIGVKSRCLLFLWKWHRKIRIVCY